MAPLEIFDAVEQGTSEWLQLRAGVITASKADLLLVNGKGPGGLGDGALTYGYELAGEILTGKPAPVFKTENTERGHAREPVIREEYEFLTETKIVEIGFMRRGRIGYSPDGLVGENGLIEIKDRLPKICLPIMTGGPLTRAEIAQAQFGMFVSGREFCDFTIGCEGIPTYIRRLEPDLEMHQIFDEKTSALIEFIDSVVSKIRNA